MVYIKVEFELTLGGFISGRSAQKSRKTRPIMEKNDFFVKTASPPLIGERAPSCYHPLYVSRKFCEKVAIKIFTNEINGIHTGAPVKTGKNPVDFRR
ncbi:MAG: hypothetical protein P4N60_00510 [Verrucomicrobiae bacterium]|nr:hypothetical protein [Verrucomicrobiae bacterium]